VRVFRSIAGFRSWRGSREGTLGLVPTMGYLHEGHLSLVRGSKSADDVTAVTIFVNPTQFGPTEDLARYPRDEARDLALLEGESVDAVFVPPVEEIYPEGFSTYVTVDGLTDRLEGASRPTHFRGVTTVVVKLLHITQPQRAYFGRKDAQQLAVIGRMARDLNLPIEIVGMPIVREPDGLALSSRNVYLSPEQRTAALSLSRGLRQAEAAFADGVRDADALRNIITRTIEAEPLAEIDYVSVADAETLLELDHVGGAALVSVAVRFAQTRLIDNLTLDA
jgi:pantoate--beta-alanine ligase